MSHSLSCYSFTPASWNDLEGFIKGSYAVLHADEKRMEGFVRAYLSVLYYLNKYQIRLVQNYDQLCQAHNTCTNIYNANPMVGSLPLLH